MLAAVISILDTMAANENAVEADWQKAAEAISYLTECLAGLVCCVPLTKLVELDGNVQPY